MRDAAGRRNVLNWFLSTTRRRFVFSVVYPVSRYLIPPDIPESTTAGVTLPFKLERRESRTAGGSSSSAAARACSCAPRRASSERSPPSART